MTLGLRLALLVGALLAALLLGLGLVLEQQLDRTSREVLDEDLAAHATAIAAALEVERDGELEGDDALEAAGGHDFRVETPAGRVLFTTTSRWPGGSGSGEGLATVVGEGGTRHRVLSRRVRPEHAERLVGEAELVLRVAGRATALDALVGRFRRALVVALALGLLVGGAAAFALARASLSPLRRLAAEIASVEATALDRRVGDRRWPADLRPLATSFDGLLARVEASFRRQRDFVGRASHALRTPIAGLLARAEVALRRERSPAEYREALAEVATLARESAQTVNDMLAVLRADEPARPRAPVRLAELAAETRRLFEPRAGVAGLELRWDVPDDLELVADRDALRELVHALLDNALRYTPRGGTAGLRASRSDGAVSLEVWDSGPGIPPAERERVFERFYRGGAAEQSGAPGSGLGLAIVKAIADAHRATVTLAERDGGGTRVVVRFAESGDGPGRHARA